MNRPKARKQSGPPQHSKPTPPKVNNEVTMMTRLGPTIPIKSKTVNALKTRKKKNFLKDLKAQNPLLIYCVSKAIRPDTSLRLAVPKSQKTWKDCMELSSFGWRRGSSGPQNQIPFPGFAKLGFRTAFSSTEQRSPTRGHSFGVQVEPGCIHPSVFSITVLAAPPWIETKRVGSSSIGVSICGQTQRNLLAIVTVITCSPSTRSAFTKTESRTGLRLVSQRLMFSIATTPCSWKRHLGENSA